jgi:hypothetical protein
MFQFKRRWEKIAYLFRADEKSPAEFKLRQTAGRYEKSCQEIEVQWRLWQDKLRDELGREATVAAPRNLERRIMQAVAPKSLSPFIPQPRFLDRLLKPNWCVAYSLLLASLWGGWFSLELLDVQRIQNLETRMVSQQPLPKPLSFKVMEQLESLPAAVLRQTPVWEQQRAKLQTCVRNNFKTRALLSGALNHNPESLLQLLALCGFVEAEFSDVAHLLMQKQSGQAKPFFTRPALNNFLPQ